MGGESENPQHKRHMSKAHTKEKKSKTKITDSDPAEAWNAMTKVEQEARIDFLWKKARTLNSKLRFQHRLRKMKEMKGIVDKMVDIEDEDEEEVMHLDLPWYMVSGDSVGLKAWDFFMTLV